ncbi:hypothetical protein CEXT_101751 [Caerostris extrusa]|uniref:Fibrinogen C-terminal domain-containing protein n=1 Tax=Caerostris extrusa TaxID=172846 RepID=A0AAV4MYC6_CAEEX|nr:hypothetical protein CEXT_101751 [Caerostris extrusa]
MRYHDRKRFATKDRDHHSFAAQFQGGWWVFYWPFSNLNGLYLPGVDDQRSVHWYIWLEDIGLANVEMKLRLRSNVEYWKMTYLDIKEKTLESPEKLELKVKFRILIR